MKERQLNSTSYHVPFLMIDSADHITGKTGLTPVVSLSKNCAAFVSASGAVTEIASGWYKLAGHGSDRDTLGALAIAARASGADPFDEKYVIVPWDPFDGLRMGLGALPYASAGAASGIITAGAVGNQLPTSAITSGAIRDDAGYWLADLILTRDWTQIFLTAASRCLWQAQRLVRNKWYMSNSPANNTLHVCKEDDATDAWTALVSGTTGADPITGTDPS